MGYHKFSKILNTFLFLFCSQKVNYQGCKSHNASQKGKGKRSDQKQSVLGLHSLQTISIQNFRIFTVKFYLPLETILIHFGAPKMETETHQN